MSPGAFNYDDAVSANRGLISSEEQRTLRGSTVAIPGLGGVGGAHLLTLTRLGVGRFAIADGDTFELRNFNRQVGATMHTIGASKTAVMADLAKAINPELAISTFPEIDARNVDEFLRGCHVVIDGLDFFRIDARRLLFRRARELGIPVITCGPLGFGVALLVFMPDGPSFDDFLDLRDSMDEREQLLRFAVALAPAALHLPYVDFHYVNLAERRGPSSSIAINLCAAVAATEALAVLLKRRQPLAVPRYAQFDPYRLRFRTGVLRGGNRHPWQRVKLWYLKRRLRHELNGR